MQLRVDTLKVGESDLLAKNHLVEADNEVCIQEPTMEDTKSKASSDELEVVQMLRVNTRRRVDLQGIVVVGGVFEQAIEGVEHLM